MKRQESRFDPAFIYPAKGLAADSELFQGAQRYISPWLLRGLGDQVLLQGTVSSSSAHIREVIHQTCEELRVGPMKTS